MPTSSGTISAQLRSGSRPNRLPPRRGEHGTADLLVLAPTTNFLGQKPATRLTRLLHTTLNNQPHTSTLRFLARQLYLSKCSASRPPSRNGDADPGQWQAVEIRAPSLARLDRQRPRERAGGDDLTGCERRAMAAGCRTKTLRP